MTRPPRAFVSWSSGKDSAFALCEARRLGLAEVRVGEIVERDGFVFADVLVTQGSSQ
ncbi:MAG: hypothetical protein ACRETH_10910 [Steroidobacteraceae bacterium]